MNLEEDIFNDFYQSDDGLNQILARDMKLSLLGYVGEIRQKFNETWSRS